MKTRRISLMAGSAIILIVAAAYHFLIGYVVVQHKNGPITVLQQKNVLHQIGANVTIYSGQHETIVVDTLLRPIASLIRSEVEALSNAPITTVIITHWHPDHSGGIASYSGDTNVIAHQSVLRKLSGPQEGFGLTKPGSHHEFPARNAEGLPNSTVEGLFKFLVDDSTVEIVHYPHAHTDGDVAIFFHDSNAVVVGDLIWPGSFPFVDAHNGGSVSGLEFALQAIIDRSKPGDLFVPGHGAILTFGEVLEYLEMVRQTRHWVESRLEDGASVDELIDAGLPEKWEHWDSALVPATVWIRMILETNLKSFL